MKADPKGVLTGEHYVDGDHAACEGALAAGCRFVAGYPITPSTEIVERFSARIPEVGGVFMQMEDELASSIAIVGAVWGGAKAMTVTSGPGFSLMQEHIGYAVMTETPLVIVDVQRGGPSTGLPTLPAQGDIMQARWGSHGDYRIIALSPNSVQECFDLMIVAFNYAEQYRVPVLFMMDESVGHMTEKLVIPPADKIEIVPRRYYVGSSQGYRPYDAGPDGVPLMPKLGEGYNIHVTGLTHDERGYPAMNAKAQAKLISRLIDKIEKNKDKIILVEKEFLEDAEVVVVSYGITSRIAEKAILDARSDGLKVGKFRLKTIWPFPQEEIYDLSSRVKAFVVPEINAGQIVLEVERSVKGRAKVIGVPNFGGTVHDPYRIYQAIKEGLKNG